jgi:hypothetical protein
MTLATRSVVLAITLGGIAALVLAGGAATWATRHRHRHRLAAGAPAIERRPAPAAGPAAPAKEPQPRAVAMHRERDAQPLADALRRASFDPELVSDPAAAFGAVVRGASARVVDASMPGSTELSCALAGASTMAGATVPCAHTPTATIDLDLCPWSMP